MATLMRKDYTDKEGPTRYTRHIDGTGTHERIYAQMHAHTKCSFRMAVNLHLRRETQRRTTLWQLFPRGARSKLIPLFCMLFVVWRVIGVSLLKKTMKE